MAITKIKRGDKSEWLELRKKYIGGADAAAVCGLNEFQSPYSLWAEKCGIVPPFEGNLRTETGAFLEDFVAKKFEQETGKKVQRSNFTFFNSAYPWGCCDIDRFIPNEDAILECKVVNELALKHYADGDYPPRFYCQVQHYLAVLDKKVAYLAILIGTGRDFKIFEIERDEKEIAALMEVEKQFYERMINNDPPPVDGSESTKDALTAQIKNDQKEEDIPEPVDLNDKKTMLTTLMEIEDTMKQLEDQKEAIRNQLIQTIGNAHEGLCEGYKITFKPQSRKTFDWKLLQKEKPQMNLEGYFKVSTSRTLKIKPISDEANQE